MRDHNSITVFRSRRTGMMYIFMGVGVCILGVLFVMLMINGWVGCLFMMSGLVVTAVSIASFRDRKPVIEISDSGLWVRNITGVPLPWRNINSVAVKAVPRGGTYIRIETKSGQSFDFEATDLDQPAMSIYSWIRAKTDLQG